jgi:hypothetical protein
MVEGLEKDDGSKMVNQFGKQESSRVCGIASWGKERTQT